MATQLETAEQLGISDRWLRKLVADGVVQDAGRNSWDALSVAKQLLAHHAALIERQKGQIASLTAQVQRNDGAGLLKADQEARRMKAMADKAEMEVAEMRGQLVPVDQIADSLHGAIVIMKTRLAAIPAKVAPIAHAAPSVAAAEKLIRDQVDEALAELGAVEIAGPTAAAA